MADAMAAFGEAFASYKKSIADFAFYSVLMEIASVFLTGVLILLLLAISAIFLGGLPSLNVTSMLSLNWVVLGIALIVALAGAVLFIWLASGLNGAYIDTLNMLLAGRKQSIGGFFGAISRKATPVFALAIVTGAIIAIPAAIIALLFSLGGGAAAIAGIGIAVLYAIVMALLLIFAVPAVIIDGRGPIAAVRHSFSASSKNIAAVIIYVVLSCLAAIPMIIPGVNLLYGPLFYMPLTQGALITLYKKAK